MTDKGKSSQTRSMKPAVRGEELARVYDIPTTLQIDHRAAMMSEERFLELMKETFDRRPGYQDSAS